MEEEISHYVNDLNSFITNARDRLQVILTRLNWKEETLLLSQKDEKEEADGASKGFERLTADKADSNSKDVDDGVVTKEEMDSEKIYNEIMASMPQPRKEKLINEDEIIREQLAAERDAKRRRISYKNKVHTKSKSQTELLRQVIEQQMLAFQEWMTEGPETVEESEVKPDITNEPSNKESSIDLIDLGDVGGNSHTLWKRLGDILGKKKESVESESRKKKRGRNEDWEGHRYDHSNKNRRYSKEEEYSEVSRTRKVRDEREDDYNYHRLVIDQYKESKIPTRERGERRKAEARKGRREERHSRKEHRREKSGSKEKDRKKREKKDRKYEKKEWERERSAEKVERKERKHKREELDRDKTPVRYYNSY